MRSGSADSPNRRSTTMFWPSTQPSCLIDIQNGFVETDFARSCGLGTGPMPRIPTRAIFSDFCASAASGARRMLPARTTASPISRIGTSVEGGCRESSRRLLIAGAGRAGRALLDHMVRPHQNRLRDREAERLGGLHVDGQLELG